LLGGWEVGIGWGVGRWEMVGLRSMDKVDDFVVEHKLRSTPHQVIK